MFERTVPDDVMKREAVQRLLAWHFSPEDIATILSVRVEDVRAAQAARLDAGADDHEDHVGGAPQRLR